MRIMIFYDLPMNEYSETKEYTIFRRELIKMGFYMLQFSIYVKVVRNKSGYNSFVKRIEPKLPKRGHIRILCITEKQYESMVFLKGNSNKHEMLIGDKEVVVFGDEDEQIRD